MTKLEQAARQALGLLEDAAEPAATQTKADEGMVAQWDVDALETIAALREALAEQAEQEPVCFVYDLTPQKRNDFINDGFEPTDPLYAAPVRTKDLTDDEIAEIHGCPPAEWVINFARAVIAADREKNRG